MNCLKSRALLLVVAVITIGLVLAWLMGRRDGVGDLLAQKDIAIEWCRNYSYLLFLAIAILPGFAFPSSPLLILAGAVWGSTPLACLLALAAVLINVSWTHALAAGPGRAVILRLLGKRWQRWERLPTADHWRIACLLRVTPGIPLFVQNYVMGLLGVPLRYSLALAIAISGFYVCGFVLTGGAIFEGRFGLFILGASILVVAVVAVKLVRQCLATVSSDAEMR